MSQQTGLPLPSRGRVPYVHHGTVVVAHTLGIAYSVMFVQLVGSGTRLGNAGTHHKNLLSSVGWATQDNQLGVDSDHASS